ncbi:MAG: cell division protein FtsA, partial [Candidatus Omnitrophota bacterium]|nr:cell division protein FtsA [Candidatus Omnitrophota bacterium]
MKRHALITGLDIGSSKVAAVVARLNDDGALNIIAHTTQPSKGISKGAYADLDAAVDCVSKAMEKLRKKISRNIGDIYVNISGQTVKGERSKGMVALSLRGREVTGQDIDKCVDAASTIKLPFGREIIHRIVRNFSVDDEAPIKNPIGLYASRLGCEVYIISSSTNHIQNIYKCVNLAGYDVKELVFTGIADGSALLSKEEKDARVFIIDMGAALTEVSLFAGGSLAEVEIAPVGVESLKDDFRNDTELNNLLSGINSRIAKEKPFSVAVTGGIAFK